MNSKNEFNYTAFQLLHTTKKNMEILEEFQPLQLGGEIEFMIYNAILAKSFLSSINEKLYEEVYDNYNVMFLRYLEELGLSSYVSNGLDFVNKRTIFYIDEIETMHFEDTWMPSRIYNCFYENPLSEIVEPSKNFTKVVLFHANLIATAAHLKKAIELID